MRLRVPWAPRTRANFVPVHYSEIILVKDGGEPDLQTSKSFEAIVVIRMPNLIIILFISFFVAACGGGDEAHPWLALPEGSPHRILEATGADEGQIVIAMDPAVTPDEALALGEWVRAQAPPGVTVNARLYNDEATARNWRTVASDWTREHLWVTVVVIPQSGRDDVRWAGPEELSPEGVDAGSLPPASEMPAPADTLPAGG